MNEQWFIYLFVYLFEGFVQHDQMKNAILEQNFIPFLLQATNKLVNRQLHILLEIIWSLAFINQAAIEIRNHVEFIERIRTMSNTTQDEGLKKAVDGLMWKLIQGQY
jgi:hypothetical protein